LDQLGTNFDKETSFSVEELQGKLSDEEIENLKIYRSKRAFLSMYSTGTKAKFDEYAVGTVLLGKFRKNWHIEALAHSSNAPSSTRLLVDTVEERGFSWTNFFRELKYWIYLTSWVFKIYTSIFIYRTRKIKVIKSLKAVKVICVHRKIHFILFNLCCIDTVFMGTRGALHMKWVPELRFYQTLLVIIFTFVVFDIIEIFNQTIKIMHPDFRRSKVLSGEFVMPNKKISSITDGKIKPKSMTLDDSNLGLNREKSLAKSINITTPKKWTQPGQYEQNYMVKNIMSVEEAKARGYTRFIDYSSLNLIFDINQAILDHATAELKTDKPELYLRKTVLLGNFSYLLRILIYHILLVALCNSPFILVPLLMITEISYSLLIFRNFIALRYFTSIHLFISKLSQSMFLLMFHAISMSFLIQNGPNSQKAPS
jgi:hypothetical protein